jgi:signal peptidase I
MLVRRIVLLVVAAVILRTWYVQGVLSPCQVTSGSMAQTLLGVHREIACGDCGYEFPCDGDVQPVSPRAVCPNCGYADNDLASRPDLAGDRVLIDRSAFTLRPPRQWEVVAFRSPQDATQVVVKRVVGLPGEAVRIRDGNVYVDGQVQRKTLSQQRAVAILVHDADFEPTLAPAPPPQWRGEGPQSRWKAAGGRFSHPPGDEKEPIDWLVYCHWQRVPGEPGAVRETPVTDDCGYNQTLPRRVEDVRPLTDLLLSFRLTELSGSGQLVLLATDGREEFRVRIEPAAGRYYVWQGGKPVPGGTGKFPPLHSGITVEISLFDQQFLLALDGQTVAERPHDPRHPIRPTARPFAIGAKGLGVVLEHLRVYRDVYYTHPIGPDARWGVDRDVRLGPDEFFVLGDNSPISQDSRTWPEGPALARRLLVGKPFLVVSASRGKGTHRRER